MNKNVIRRRFFAQFTYVFISVFLTFITSGSAYAIPSFSKVFTPNTIGPGSVSTATFTITNNDGFPLNGLAFSDVLPTVPGDIDIASPASASTTCLDGVITAPNGGGTIGFSSGKLGTGESCTITVDITGGTTGAHTNPAVTLTYDELDGDPPSSLPVDITVVSTLPGFSKSFAPSSVSLGGKSTLTFTIDNSTNTSPIGNLDFTDNLPAGMLVANPPNAATDCISANAPDTTLTAVAGTSIIALDADGSTFFPGFEVLPAGATCTVTVDVVATGVGMLNNQSGDLLADFTSAGKANDSLEVTVTPLAIQKSFKDDPVPAGSTVELEFTINNFDRNFSATGIAFTDDLTAITPTLVGVTFDSLLSNDCGGSVSGVGGTTIGFSGGTIAPESSCTVRASLAVSAAATPGAYTNTTSTVTGTVDGSPVVGNMATDDLFVAPVPILTKEFLEVGTLASDPIIDAGVSSQDVVLRFTVTNTSTTSGATDVAFIDELTDGGPGTGFLPFPIAAVLPATPCGAGSSLGYVFPDTDRQGLSLTGGSLAAAGMPGDSCTFDVTVTIPASFPPGVYVNTTEEPTATVDGATRIGKPASDSLTVVSAPILSKEFSDDPVAPGSSVTLEFTLTYPTDASGDATGITFTDDLAPVLAGLTASSLPLAAACDPDGPGGNPGTGTVNGSAADTLLTFSGGTLSPGESCTISVPLNVPAAAASGAYTNTTSGVSATVGGLAVTSAPSSDDLQVGGMIFSKEFLGGTAFPGKALTLRFTLQNISSVTATGIGFSDSLFSVAGLIATDPALADDCGGTLTVVTIPGFGSSLTYAGGSLAAGATCNLDVEVTVPVTASDGVFQNFVSGVSYNLGATSGFDGPAIDNLVVDSDQLSLLKAFTDDPVSPGDTVTLEFTLANLDASQAASGIGFTDDLGATLSGLTFDSVLFNDCGATVAGTGTDMITVSGASLAAAGSCTLRASLTVPGGAAANTYTNTTSAVTGTIAGLAVTGDPASDDLEVGQLLGFSKSFDGPATATGTATLTFTITNPGSNTATGISFSDDLNSVIPGLIAISLPATPCGAGSSITGIGFLTMTGGQLPPAGGMCSFDVDVLVPAAATAGTFPNTTSDLLQSGLFVADSATADLVIEPPPTFAKVFAPDSILAGASSTLTFTVDNSASALAASSLDFTDNLPAGLVIASPANAGTTCAGGTLTAVSGAAVVTYSGGQAAAGASCTITVDITGTSGGAFVNTSGDLTSSSGNSGTATDTLTITSSVDVSVTKTDGVTSATPGGSVTYTIVAANTGPSDDPAVTLSDTFPAALACTYTSVAAGGATGNTAAGSGNLSETLSMPAGSSVTYTAVCGINASAAGTLSNTATVNSSITDAQPGNNSATDSDTVLVASADISVTKTDGVTSATPGGSVTYTIVAANAGPSNVPAVTLSDTFPSVLTCTFTSTAAGGALGNTASGSGNLAETLLMPVGSSVTYTATCDIDSGATGTLSNTATVNSSVSDAQPGNNSATDSDTVLLASADISVTKTDGVTSATPGDSVTYTIVAANAGPSDDPSVTLADTFPAALTCNYTSVAAGGATGNTASGSGDLAETLSMPVGSSVTYTAVCNIDAGATGTLSNTASVTASVTDSDTSNDSATDSDTVLTASADISVTKTDGVTSAIPGGSVMYTIVAANAGPSDDSAVTLSDTFPAALTCTYTSVAAGGATGNTASGSGNLSETLSMPAGSSVTYTAICNINIGATGTLSNTATVTASVTDTLLTNNSATDDDTVLAPAPVRSFTGPLNSGTIGTISFTSPDPACTFASDPQFIDDATFVPAPPMNLVFIDGLISFVIENCAPGATVNLTVDYGQALDPATVQNWKAGTPWFILPSTISGSTMSYSITDGGLGDEDTIPGRITDPHGAAIARAAAIPTNSTLGILLLVSLLMLSGLLARRYGHNR